LAFGEFNVVFIIGILEEWFDFAKAIVVW